MKFVTSKHFLCAAALVSTLGALTAGTSEAAGSEAAANWGTAPVRVVKSGPTPNYKTARIARQTGFDRAVYEFDTAIPSYHVYYTTELSQCGSGDPLTIAGSKHLQVTFDPAQSWNFETGQPTYAPASIEEIKSNLTSIEEAEMSCPGFEAETSYILGINGTKNFRVTELSNPPRVIIDVQH